MDREDEFSIFLPSEEVSLASAATVEEVAVDESKEAISDQCGEVTLDEPEEVSSERSEQLTLEQSAVVNFQNYLRIPSVHPDVNYDHCVDFLKAVAKELDLPCRVHTLCPNKPIVLITWFGKEPHLPSVLLNSHMDVVPVFEEMWTHKPFKADIVDGKIYARGTQDMKSVGIQYLEAIRNLKCQGVSLKRTIHVSFTPDEEIGGADGMGKFVETAHFVSLHVGFAMDESMPSSSEQFLLFYGERYSWKLDFHCTGRSCHGSSMSRNTPGERVTHIMQRLYEFRDTQRKKLGEKGIFGPNVISMNVTLLKGGVHDTVVPPEFTIGVDIRIAPDVDVEQFEEEMNQWCREAGEGVWIEFKRKDSRTPCTNLDNTNPFWVALKQAFDELCIEVIPLVGPGDTDVRYVRTKGIPAVGFSPINNTPSLMHEHDEYISEQTFLRGIEIYCKVITNIANV